MWTKGKTSVVMRTRQRIKIQKILIYKSHSIYKYSKKGAKGYLGRDREEIKRSRDTWRHMGRYSWRQPWSRGATKLQR